VVEIGLNGPPFLEPGFKSHMSIVGGPPDSQISMVDLPLVASFAAAAGRAIDTADRAARKFLLLSITLPPDSHSIVFMVYADVTHNEGDLFCHIEVKFTVLQVITLACITGRDRMHFVSIYP